MDTHAEFRQRKAASRGSSSGDQQAASSRDTKRAASSLSIVLSLPSMILSFIVSMLGLSSGEIEWIVPSRPARLDRRTPNGGQVGRTGDGEKGSVISRWIEENVPSLMKGGFKPTWWLFNGHLQTMFSVVGDFSKIDQVDYVRTYLRVPDGGTIGLDFTPPNHGSLPPDTPTLVVCHGLTGGSHESYVRNVLAKVMRPESEGGLGIRAVVVNFRGCAGVPVTSDQLYSAGTTLDLSIALHYIRSTYPTSPLLGIGFSLGAAVLTNYLGQTGSQSLLSSGIALGPPMDLPAMSYKLEHHWFISRVYSRAMGLNLINLFFKHYGANPKIWEKSQRLAGKVNIGVEESVLEKLKTMRKGGFTLKVVDDYMVSKIGGPLGIGAWPFQDAYAYYEWASPKKVVDKVKRPLLVIGAADDPIIDSRALPRTQVSSSTHVLMAITPRGGHLGWFTGPKANERWVAEPIMEYLRACVRDLGLEGSSVEMEMEGDDPKSPSSEASEHTDARDSSEDERDKEWEKVKRPSDPMSNSTQTSPSSSGATGSKDWSWVRNPAHNVPGIGSASGKIGWKVLAEGQVVHGAEGTGTLQGL
ncbi:Alpha/Beta hydrolase protein [Kockovaella imperatae]|uniref:Alpha/Beta hydrolase protein n=1 Tax=Kockovaella imperatae TaxID=4999 RepID=A0A1Y1U9Y0_9TREE|nr:Alpha/Beta hydrolase protein [Kockovaella imperatae]ORX34833.1 Alpha/Beta hydrolase protein [Kockovaella imperatae]